MRSKCKTTVGSLFVCFLLDHHLRLPFTLFPLHLSTNVPFFTFTLWSIYHKNQLRGWLPVTPKNSINHAAYQGQTHHSLVRVWTLTISSALLCLSDLPSPWRLVETFQLTSSFPDEDYLSGSSAAVSAPVRVYAVHVQPQKQYVLGCRYKSKTQTVPSSVKTAVIIKMELDLFHQLHVEAAAASDPLVPP